MSETQPSTSPDGRAAKPARRSRRSTAGSVLRLIEVRLRFPIILAAAALVVGRWDVLRNHWDRLTRASGVTSSAAQAVSNDTEYFCPMDPGVVADWPGKCGICNMALVRRKRGDMAALPEGVIARVQVSPYRLQLGGIQTATLGYQALTRTFRTTASVRKSGAELVLEFPIASRHGSWLGRSPTVTVRPRDSAEQGSLRGQIHFPGRTTGQGGGLLEAIVTVSDNRGTLVPGMLAEVTCEVPVCELEPFRSQPRDPPPLKPGEPRAVFSCRDHPDALGTAAGRCPIDQSELGRRPLAAEQRLRWWCPMHPEVTADHAGEACQPCGGMILKPRVVSYLPRGKVLAVPETAVIDTGRRTVVFVESMPGTFDGVEVVLGPRCGESYPVVRGLEAGQRVAAAGSFLLDAETRLNPSLAAGYFGAAGRAVTATAATATAEATTAGSASTPEVQTSLDALPPPDRALAQAQKLCPVTRKPLGSMGKPVRIVVSGRVVFLCCAGCEDAVRSNPEKYLPSTTPPARP